MSDRRYVPCDRRRISAGDAGSWRFRVLDVNGNEIKNCVLVDLDIGVVRFLVTDRNGKIKQFGDHYVSRREYGHYTLEEIDDGFHY